MTEHSARAKTKSQKASSFARRLLAWFKEHGRHDLPWQRSPTPYRVWISEIMLQQTQVETVRPYFERWMQQFPDIASLAAASQDDVMHLWSGLGYYARARNAWRAARVIQEEHGGRFPETLEEVMALPGIGRSTAGAILALSLNQRHPILDGNVKRVLTRFHAVAGWPGKRPVEQKLWALAEEHTPPEDTAAYTQAIMDLGATVCLRARPLCDQCPVARDCAARLAGSQAAYPESKPKKARPLRTTVMAIFVDDKGRVLLQKRPPTGIWGGLWSLPEFGSTVALNEHLSRRVSTRTQVETWPELSHGFTHFQLAITPVKISLSAPVSGVAEPFASALQEACDEREAQWVNPATLPGVGLAAPVTQLLKQLAE